MRSNTGVQELHGYKSGLFSGHQCPWGYVWPCRGPLDLITFWSIRVKMDPSILSSFTNTTQSLHFLHELCWWLLFPSPLFLSHLFLSVLSRILGTSPGQLSSLAANHLASGLSGVMVLYPDAWSGPVCYDYVRWPAVWGKLLSELYSVRVSWSLVISHMSLTLMNAIPLNGVISLESCFLAEKHCIEIFLASTTWEEWEKPRSFNFFYK